MGAHVPSGEALLMLHSMRSNCFLQHPIGILLSFDGPCLGDMIVRYRDFLRRRWQHAVQGSNREREKLRVVTFGGWAVQGDGDNDSNKQEVGP